MHPLPTPGPGRGRLDSNGQDDKSHTEPRWAKPPLSPHALFRKTRPQPPDQCSASPQIESHWYFRASDGRSAPWYCDRWDCPHCAERKASRWADIIALAAPQRHIVLTGLGPDPAHSRRQLAHIFQAARRGQFCGAGSRSNHVEFEYFSALESHPCGFVHAHILQRGRSIPKRQLSAALPGYGAGRVCWIRSISQADRPAAVARYVARHLVGHQHFDQIKAGRRVRYSRNFWGGCTVAEVTAALWPRDPDPSTWHLVRPLTGHSPAHHARLELDAYERRLSRAEALLGDTFSYEDFQAAERARLAFA